MTTQKHRCSWVPQGGTLYERYHDEEWGVPVYDDMIIFEFLVLESAQAGLSWRTILGRREGYRSAFSEFIPDKVALYTQKDIECLLKNARIIRNRKKIEATVHNAQRFLEVQNEHGSFSNYIWGFAGGIPKQNAWKRDADVPAKTETSEAIARDMKKRGFTFLGPTIMYAHMQATGMVNDHITSCFRYQQCRELK